ncbi:g-patch domain protein [Moniliophthora roreri MCA 2997]|uniref:G-patch domain protein n=1 Tax=Moniliophthora roreri (strain MCA 2997) TaxID=1381753 RepID=V2XLF8_MONRO|nr:g-patch domain protein [Moniliophthora roreri MCA 2997]KAI3609635.1 g-patch domain protein [Moniliophthora roreri]
MSAPAQKVSFTVRRPTPVSRATSSGADSDSGSSFKVPALPRYLANTTDSAPGSPLARSGTSSPKARYEDLDSSDEDEEIQDELVTGFDKFGVERLNKPKKAPEGPLIIPALKNRDWREIAKKRRTTGQFVPESAKAGKDGADGSVGGLGTRETTGTGPVLSGLQVKKKEVVAVKEEDAEMAEVMVKEEKVEVEKVEETEDQRALRAILAGADGDGELDLMEIPMTISEADAYKQDVGDLPDSASLDDYNRVPVSQFGAAMLRGMGWKEGTAASRRGKGAIEPYIPEARPALLGIGAKEMEVFDDGSVKKGSKRPEKRYIPVVKKDRDGNVVEDTDRRDRDRERRRERSISPRRDSRAPSRRGSPDRRDYDDRRKDYSRWDSRRDREYDFDRDKDRNRERQDRDRDYDRDHRDRRRTRDRDDRDRRRDRS